MLKRGAPKSGILTLNSLRIGLYIKKKTSHRCLSKKKKKIDCQ